MLQNFDNFKKTFSGKIILPTDKEYTQASTVFLSTGTPALIVKPSHAQDVAVAIKFARDSKLAIAVRSGGHSGQGFGTNNGGIVIDVSAMNTVELIDAEEQVVKIGTGARWIEVAEKLRTHGLALSSGDTKTVGVGGLTLGGGIGWLVRKVGLTIDNLLAAEIVTSNGEILRTSSTENSELFWAIRGGGGNFGIVTSFEFTAYPLTEVYAGPISYSIEEVGSVLKNWRDVMRKAPDELNSTALVMPSFAGNPPGVMLLNCYAGDDEQTIEPLKKLGKLVFQDVKKKAYAEVLEDAHPPQGVEIITKVMFVKDFSDEFIDAIAEQCKVQIHIIQIRYLGGAMNKVASDATAFAHRDKEVLIVVPAFIPLNSTPEVVTKALEPWSKLVKFGSGTYSNLLSTNTAEDVKAMYPGSTYERLAKIKKQYDPENVFKSNLNIEPKK